MPGPVKKKAKEITTGKKKKLLKGLVGNKYKGGAITDAMMNQRKKKTK